MTKHTYTRAMHDKGWQLKELAVRWGIKPRSMSNLAANPKLVHWSAMDGLELHPREVLRRMRTGEF